MAVVQIIRDLLWRNERLVVPGLGMFSVVHKPAQISRSTRILIPPSSEIAFDPHSKPQDNQLLLALRKKFGITETEAGEKLRRFLHELEEKLKTQGKARMDGFGELSLDGSGKLGFRPDQELLAPDAVFSLPRIEIPDTMIQDASPRIGSDRLEHLQDNGRGRVRLRRILVITTILIGLAALFYFIALPAFFVGKSEPVDRLIRPDSRESRRMVFGKKPRAEQDTLHDSISHQLDKQTARITALRPEPEHSRPASAETSPSPATILPSGPYHVIAGAFTLPGNAQNLVQTFKSKGVDAELLPKRGKYTMVSLGSYPSRTAADFARDKLAHELNRELWVMKREP